MSSNSNTSENQNWPQTKNKNTKTCFLEDLEEEMNAGKTILNGKGRLNQDNEKQNSAAMYENNITRSTFSASTPNIFSLSTSSIAKSDFKLANNGNQPIGIKRCIMHILVIVFHKINKVIIVFI